MTKSSCFLGIISMMLFFSCSNSNQQSTDNKTVTETKSNFELTTVDNKTTYSVGDSIPITIKLLNNVKFDSIQCSVDGKKVATLTTAPYHFAWSSKDQTVGTHNLSFVAAQGKNLESNTKTITLLSDIAPKQFTYKVLKVYPHDMKAYTQGLFYLDGFLYEGTGRNKMSSLRKVELETGKVLQSSALSEEYFGEGITLYKDKIYQLTWQNQTGFVYDKNTFKQLQQFSYNHEGWGLVTIGEQLLMSDGTSTMYYLNPENFAETGSVQVYDNQGPVTEINELEYINGEVYANIYQTNKIAKIDIKTGKVLAWIDMSGLLKPEDKHPDIDVLNGIAYDAGKKRLFVTGKNWGKLFEIQLIEKSAN